MRLGDEEVARALGRRAGEDRRLEVEEVVRVEVVAHRAHDRVAQHHRVAHPLAAQVEHAVAQAQRLVDRRRPRRPGTAASRTRRACSTVARRRARSRPSARFGLTLPSSRRTTSPAAETTCSERSRSASGVRLRRGLGMEDELHEARAVAQVDEDQAAVVAPAVHPAGDADGLARRARRSARRTRRRGSRWARGGLTASPRDVVHDRVGAPRRAALPSPCP